jgi:N-acetylmuramoyl-L-alanine amidase
MEIKYLIVHHSAVSRDKNSEQFDAINNYHKSRGWGAIGYHFLIEPDGKIRIGRIETQSGAHCIGHNYDSLGICLSGNFDIEKPTKKQERSLKILLIDSLEVYPKAQIKYHRDFANKTCPGKLIADNWAKNLISKNKIMEYVIQGGEQYIRYQEPFKIAGNITDPSQLEDFKKKGLKGSPREVTDMKDYMIFPLIDKAEGLVIIKRLRDVLGF